MSWFPDKLLRYFLNEFKIFSVALITAGIIFVFIFHLLCIFIIRSFYFKNFSAFCCSLWDLMKLPCLLSDMFLFHYRDLWYQVYCWGWFCQFLLVDSVITLPSCGVRMSRSLPLPSSYNWTALHIYCHGWFLPIFVQSHASVPFWLYTCFLAYGKV
jgi:hypothetical protein